MRKFIRRALDKFEKLDANQVQNLIFHLATDHDRLEDVLGSLRNGLIVADENNNLAYMNRAAERFLPIIPFEVHERLVWTALEDVEIADFIEKSITEKETVIEKEFTLERNGKSLTLSLSVIPLLRKGKIQGNLIIAEDITEKRQNEARLRRAETLASLTTLTAGVAHEIKNPLGSIGIHLQLIQKLMANRETVETADIGNYLEIINEEVDRLNHIVVDFLFAVRPIDIQPTEGDINKLISDLISFVRFELEDAKIVCNLELEEIPEILFDEKYIKQAFLNIIKNAIHAMPEGGSLTVRTQRSGNLVHIEFIDTGVGMTEEVKNKIFEPYFTTRDFGSGIGLTLVYKIVKEHGGDITVHSQPEKGAKFDFSFPVPQKEKRLIVWDGGNDEI